MINAAIFDFGGVIADEGYKNGMHEIAQRNGLDKDEFLKSADEILFSTGYITGKGSEETYWRALREKTGISGTSAELREIIFKGFVVRKWMIEIIQRLRSRGIRLAVLSDQTNWLSELEASMKIYSLFERIFNSYDIGKSKRDITVFTDVIQAMGLVPENTLFIDDNAGNVERAMRAGLGAIHYTGKDAFLQRLTSLFPDLFDRLEGV